MSDEAQSPSVYRAPPPPTVPCEACDARVPPDQAVQDASGRTVCRTCRTLGEIARGQAMAQTALGRPAPIPRLAPPSTTPSPQRSGPSGWAIIRIVAIAVLVVLKLALLMSR